MGFLGRVLRDKFFRRFLVASCFAGAFVWVAIDAFGVSKEEVLKFFIMSILMVLGMVLVALPFALLLRFLFGRRRELGAKTGPADDPQEKSDSN